MSDERRMRLGFVLFFLATRASSLALRGLLSKGKPIVVELRVDAPADAWELDIQEISARLRTAGVTALVAPSELVGAFVEEQSSARGNFPGPVPVLCDVSLDGNAELAALSKAGAAGIAVKCAGGDSALTALLEDASAAKLEAMVIAGTEEASTLADAGGAAAIACEYEGAAAAAAASSTSAVRLGAWDGDDDALAAKREEGFSAFLLLDGCGGDVAPPNAAWCEGRVRAFRSKASSQWGGSMFASTNSDVQPPSVRNPRMWAQSQRQAREIMHESARSRDLPPPKIPRNTVL